MKQRKPNWKKSAIYPIVLIVLVLIVYQYRESKKAETYIQIEGNTMGTTYHIKYIDDKKINYKSEIDNLLVDFNQSLSTYISDSEISQFNQSDSIIFRSEFFLPVLIKAKEVYEFSKGAFDPTVMPLVNAWGFGFKNSENIDSTDIDSLMQFVGFEHIIYNENSIKKDTSGVMLDFSAIAKGYGVDLIGEYFEERGIKNYMVEIGGEVRCRGKNNKNSIWLIGIDNPKYNEDGKSLKATVKLENLSLATSGNYRNFYVKEGVKYAHTINPITGYPVDHTLLSASVFSENCMTADAYATAFMVMGTEATIELARELGLMIYLVYSDENGETISYMSDGLRKMIIEN
ncbi:FAD:protein FMN transferase [Hyphobacterium sp. CCMP332]|nr:FAD:protein FMN transferase [Hyphobacterium sp. CCMP332]